MPSSTAASLTNQRRTLIFIDLMLVAIAGSILVTAVSNILPSLATYFGVSTSLVQWVTSGYTLALGMVVPLTAFLITRFPIKRLYIVGTICFMLGIVVSAISSNFTLMMVGRILQACGNGVLAAAMQVIILTIYPEERKGAMMGTYGFVSSAASMIAPTLAGLVEEAFGWQSVFYLVLAILVVSLIMSILFLSDVLELQDKQFDVVSFIESLVAFGGITWGVGNLTSYGLLSIEAGVPLLVGAIVCALFMKRQLGLETPFLDVSILRNFNYSLSLIASMLLYLVMMGSMVLMPLYVQNVLGYSSVISGLAVLPGSLASAIVSPFAGKLYDKIGIKKIFVVGSATLLVGNIGMVLIPLDTPLWVSVVLNVVRCGATGALFMTFVTWGVSHVDKRRVADATSMLSTFRTVAGTIGMAVFVGVMAIGSASSSASSAAAAQMFGVNMAYLGMAAVSVVLLALAIFAVSDKPKEA